MTCTATRKFYYSSPYCLPTWQFMEYEFDTLEEVRRCAEYYGVYLHIKTPTSLHFGSLYQ